MRASTLLQLAAITAVFSTIYSHSIPKISPPISSFAEIYFQNHPAIMAFFCEISDAIKAVKNGVVIQSRLISKSEDMFGNFVLALGQNQRVGIFVDLRCSEGNELLKLSSQLFNASYSWLLLTNDTNATLNLLQNSRASIDSRLMLIAKNGHHIQFFDTYRVHVNGQFVTNDISSDQSPDGKLHIPSKYNFHGYQLVASTLFSEFPFNGRQDEHNLMNPNYKQYVAGMRRYAYVILTLLSDFYNFDFNIKVATSWHSVLPNGTPTGMLAELAQGKYDFAIAPSYYVTERLNIVSLPAVLGSLNYFFAFRQPITIGSPTALVSPISSQGWLSLFAILLISFVILRFLLYKDPCFKSPYSWSESFIIVGGAISQRSVTEMGSKNSTRIGLISVLLMALITNYLYNTSVLNGLLIKAPDAIQNVKQLLQSNLKITSNNVTYLKVQLKQSDSISQRFVEKISKSDKPFVKLGQGVELVRSGQYAMYVLADDFYQAAESSFSTDELCSTSELKKERPFPWGYTAVKNSPYREHIRRGIMAIQESGIKQRLIRLFQCQKPDCNDQTQIMNPFSMKTLSLAFVLLAGGIVSSIVVFSFEFAVHRRVVFRLREDEIVDRKLKSISSHIC